LINDLINNESSRLATVSAPFLNFFFPDTSDEANGESTQNFGQDIFIRVSAWKTKEINIKPDLKEMCYEDINYIT
jgi:hypothetical protein